MKIFIKKLNISLYLILVVGLFLSCLTNSSSAQTPMDEPTLKTKLSEVLGDKSSWNPAVVKDLKRGLSCEEVKKIYTTIDTCDPTASKEQNGLFSKVVKVAGHPLIEKYRFAFDQGKLTTVGITFYDSLDKELFKKVSLELGEAKWGPLAPEKKGDDLLTWISGVAFVQRHFLLNRWMFLIELPK